MFKQMLKILQGFWRLFDHFVNKTLKVILRLVLTKFTDQKRKKFQNIWPLYTAKKMYFIFHIVIELIMVLIRCDVRRCVDSDTTLGYSHFL